MRAQLGRRVTSLQVLVARKMCKARDRQAIGLNDLEACLKAQGWEDPRAKQVVARFKVQPVWALQRSSEFSLDSQIAAANVCKDAPELLVPISAKHFGAILDK